ncbi:serine/arginine repetitive matrix protein 1-like [Pecten maximus]|uniref:serine/arginine repetitive matrix protein 1-like n=1 Tax=Pecten maximus TaxID=6579 RepID=UPI001458D087|nr:serine/arginine repetitive matrix protein 1-like [Pecten maximus]
MSMLSQKQPKKKSLKLLEKLVQDNSSEEGAEEREALLDSLIKENGGNLFYEKMNGSYTKKGKSKAGKEADNERQSRSRTKDQHERILSAKKPPTGQGSISVPSGHVKNGKSRSRSRSDSRSSSSSFWSDRSKSRSRSRSRSPKRGTPRRRSYSSSRSRSHSRSRSRSHSKSRSRSRSKSSSPHSYIHGVQRNLNLKNSSKPHDTMSEQGHRHRKRNQQGRKTKLLNRSPLRKFRSMDISPDVFIEERLNRKYRELHELVQTNFSDRRPQVTREYFNQIQSLRDSYTKVSHGMQPSGILLPGTGTLSDIKPPGVPQRRRPMSASTHAELRDLTMEDGTYYTIRNVMTASTAKQQQKVRTDINGEGFNKKKKKKRSDQKRKDSGSTLDSTSQHNGYYDDPPSNRTPSSSKATGSPRSKELPEPTDHHIKHSNNPKLLSWLKQKDIYHRKQKREERQKKKEERQKLILEANEKFEKRLESQKRVEKWMKKKHKECKKKDREEKMREDIRTRERIDQENVNRLTVPGKPLRPQSAPPSKREGSQQMKEGVAPQVANTTGMEPHPPASKFIYKRPVAGRIKLAMKDRPKSASVVTPQRNASASPRRSSARDNSHENKQRMSYEDWLQQKRKHDIKQKKEIQLQKEELAKSDPELAKIVPEIAKKRIHRVLEGKKSIDTGIKNFDDRANKSFGGADFQEEDVSTAEERSPRPSYRLESDRVNQTDPKNTSKNLKLSGQSVNMDSRPGTAPPRARVPTPKQSSNSPRKAVAPPKDKMSDEVSAGFSLPFQEKDGVPKHVASTQRKLFAEKVWEKLEGEERPEPQGCAAIETPQHPQHPQADRPKVDNSRNADNSTKSDNSNEGEGDIKDSKEEKTDEEKEEVVGAFFLTSREDILDDMKTEKEPTETEQKTENPSVEEDRKMGDFLGQEDIKNGETEAKVDEVSSEVEPPVNDLEMDSGDLTDGSNTQNGQNDQQEVKDIIAEDNGQKTNGIDSELHLNSDDLRPESANTSRSLKHVSFREETEILGKDEPEGEEVDWSTDTATPDNDDYACMAKDDLNVDEETNEDQDIEDQTPEEIDSQMSRTSQAQSMEDDF